MSNIFKFIGNERGDSICEEADGCLSIQDIAETLEDLL